MDLDGIILVDKPGGWTSFDAIAKIRGVIKAVSGKKVKVGHTGTLDPLATGLMVVVIGSYCKRASEFSKLEKTYEITMKLGETSTTGDDEGDKTAVSTTIPDEKALKTALGSFTGEIMQVPPAYSAVKISGKRAYKLAREGKTAAPEPRKVMIHSLDLVKYEYPQVFLTANVGSGTYIRSLVQDLGENLGTGAYTAELRRTRVGQFGLAEAAISPKDVSFEQIYEAIRKV